MLLTERKKKKIRREILARGEVEDFGYRLKVGRVWFEVNDEDFYGSDFQLMAHVFITLSRRKTFNFFILPDGSEWKLGSFLTVKDVPFVGEAFAILEKATEKLLGK